MPTVTVRGDALVRTEPDEAVLWITLSALDDAPGPALSDVSARSTTLMSLLDEIEVGKAERSTTGVTVYEDFDHTEKGRRLLGHQAVARVSVRLADPQGDRRADRSNDSRSGSADRRAEPGEQHVAVGAAAARGFVMGEPMPVEPGEHEVTASIQATFALDAGE